ncbi:MAG: efflux RND transporter periplasmic adaptor subunit [Verrucomicrobia bacterium]|jgi:HlyD family secretion protein|nr:efflux RND transporter periplasmic adaptor subunit [Verrucomicrobiota bacterium]
MNSSRKRRKLIVFSLIGLGLVGLTTWTLLRNKEAAVPVQTEKVSRRDMTEIVVANGRVEPVTQVNISPEVSGEIVELPVVEGQSVRKGDLLVRIKPQQYEASRDSARANYESARAGLTTAQAQLARAEAEYLRNKELFDKRLVSESLFVEVETTYNVERARLKQAEQQIANAKAALERAEEDLLKTAIYSPLEGTVTRLKSQLGERVHGTAMMAGTDIMTVANLDEMDAMVDIGEMDIVLIKSGQKARLEVDAFRDQKFTGAVYEIANASKGSGTTGTSAAAAASQEATKFEVKIRFNEKAALRPGMSVTAEIETQYRTNVLAVPIASVTTRPPKHNNSTNSVETADSGKPDPQPPGPPKPGRREREKAIEVVFTVDNGRARQQPVKIGISDEDYWEITEGLEAGDEIVTGGYRAISRDLQDGSKITKDTGTGKKPGQDEKGSAR